MSTSDDTRASDALRQLLRGESLSDEATFGAWTEVIRQLNDALTVHGEDEMVRLFNALASSNVALLRLAASAGGANQRPTGWESDELLSGEDDEPDWIVPELLPHGLIALTGRPKVGKSWLAMQIATAVTFGDELWGVPVRQRRVLYLALEDNRRRLRRRLTAQQRHTDAVCATRTGRPSTKAGSRSSRNGSPRRARIWSSSTRSAATFPAATRTTPPTCRRL